MWVLLVQVSPGHPNDLIEVPRSASAIARADCLDGMKNAIHSEAVQVLLPHIDDLDYMSWWISQALQFQLASGCFPGYSVILGGYIDPPEELLEHGPYPRGMNHTAALEIMEKVFGNAGLMPKPVTGTEYPQGDCTGLGSRYIATEMVFNSGSWMDSDSFMKCRTGLRHRFEEFMASATRD
jgi:hypothetical protein